MSKNDLVASIAEISGLTKADSEKAVNAFMEAVTTGLKSEGKVTLVGFGTFEAKKRPAREGRNPLTGEKLTIAAKVAPTFKAGSKLKDALN